jgi:hypothetical protein
LPVVWPDSIFPDFRARYPVIFRENYGNLG